MDLPESVHVEEIVYNVNAVINQADDSPHEWPDHLKEHDYLLGYVVHSPDADNEIGEDDTDDPTLYPMLNYINRQTGQLVPEPFRQRPSDPNYRRPPKDSLIGQLSAREFDAYERDLKKSSYTITAVHRARSGIIDGQPTGLLINYKPTYQDEAGMETCKRALHYFHFHYGVPVPEREDQFCSLCSKLPQTIQVRIGNKRRRRLTASKNKAQAIVDPTDESKGWITQVHQRRTLPDEESPDEASSTVYLVSWWSPYIAAEKIKDVQDDRLCRVLKRRFDAAVKAWNRKQVCLQYMGFNWKSGN